MTEENIENDIPPSTRKLDIDGDAEIHIDGLDLWYGTKQALYDVSLPIAKNCVTSLILKQFPQCLMPLNLRNFLF